MRIALRASMRVFALWRLEIRNGAQHHHKSSGLCEVVHREIGSLPGVEVHSPISKQNHVYLVTMLMVHKKRFLTLHHMGFLAS